LTAQLPAAHNLIVGEFSFIKLLFLLFELDATAPLYFVRSSLPLLLMMIGKLLFIVL
jgi:hypothetical protein